MELLETSASCSGERGLLGRDSLVDSKGRKSLPSDSCCFEGSSPPTNHGLRQPSPPHPYENNGVCLHPGQVGERQASLQKVEICSRRLLQETKKVDLAWEYHSG